MQIDHQGARGTNERKFKIRSKGVGKELRDLLLEFISRECMKLGTSKLACRLTTGGTDEKSAKIRSKGVAKVSHDLILVLSLKP